MEDPLMRVRALVCASLVTLLGWHLAIADAVTAPDAHHIAPVAVSGPSRAQSDAQLANALRANLAYQATKDADLAAWYAAASKPAPAHYVKQSGGSGTITGYEGDIWWALSGCESGHTNAATGNGFWGYFQFTLATWHGIGYSGSPTDYDYATQKQAAQELQARSGWGQWPACAKKLGLL